MNVDQMPSINAALNALATLFLLLGYICIKRDKKDAHKKLMIAAFATSTIFLACYLWYHYNSALHTVLRHPVPGVNYLYYFILITHVILAAIIIPLALFTLYRGWNNQIGQHRRIARITLPIWLYVSVTGVIIYLMLY